MQERQLVAGVHLQYPTLVLNQSEFAELHHIRPRVHDASNHIIRMPKRETKTNFSFFFI